MSRTFTQVIAAIGLAFMKSTTLVNVSGEPSSGAKGMPSAAGLARPACRTGCWWNPTRVPMHCTVTRTTSAIPISLAATRDVSARALPRVPALWRLHRPVSGPRCVSAVISSGRLGRPVEPRAYVRLTPCTCRSAMESQSIAIGRLCPLPTSLILGIWAALNGG